MSSVTLYKSDNTSYSFGIGNVAVGGSYPFNVGNLWGFSGTMPSGTVNGVTVPSMDHYVDWTWNTNPPTLTSAGTNLQNLGSIIGVNSSISLYTKENSSGTRFQFDTDANAKITRIYYSSGSYSGTYQEQVSAENIYFVWANGIGLSQYDNLCLFFEHTDPNDHQYGLHFGGACSFNALFTNSTSSNIQTRFDSGSLISAGPGDPGFKPIGDLPKKPTFGGGRISGRLPAYYTDTLTQPGAPDETAASAVRSGLINVYELSEANLVALGRALFGTEGVNGLITKLQNSFLNPLDAILSLQIFPCSPDVGSSEHIKLFDWSSSAAKLGTDTSGNRLTSQYKTIDFGDIQVEEQWNSFLDYDNTTCELYLPFIGAVDLPIDEVMDGSVNIQYTIDFLTGMCVANVFCTKSVPLSSDRNAPQVVQHSYMGNCAVQIPLNNVSYGNIIGSLMNAASSGLRAGAGGAIMSVVESGLNGGFKPEVSTKGTISANAGFCSVLYPYITVTRPITAEPDAFQEVMGYTSYIKSTLGDYEGLCVCDEIDLTGIAGATDSELEEIRNICKSGIYV